MKWTRSLLGVITPTTWQMKNTDGIILLMLPKLDKYGHQCDQLGKVYTWLKAGQNFVWLRVFRHVMCFLHSR